MIRFSAALVAVAIGVLIGGIAASTLLLVYIAIVLSAVALVVLAIGIALKREELFGETQGRGTAQAGASPVMPVWAAEGYRQGQGADGYVPPPPLQGAAVGPGAAFAGHGPAGHGPAGPGSTGDSPAGPGLTGHPPAGPGATGHSPAGHGPVASPQPGTPQPGTAWGAQAASDAWAPQVPTGPAPVAWQAPPVPVGGSGGGWDVPPVGASATTGDPAVQGAPAMPSAWGTPPVGTQRTVGAPGAAGAPAAGPESSSPNWFNPAEGSVEADAPATATGSGRGWSWPGPGAATGPEDNGDTEPEADDDWPARYSWLDDEPADPAGSTATSASGVEAPEGGAVPGNIPVSAAPADAGPEHAGSEDAAAPGRTGPGERPGADLAAPADAAPAELAEAPAVLRLVRDPGDSGVPGGDEAGAADVPAEPEPAPGDAFATEARDQAPATGMVTVVRGVPRFHREGCILTRFMPEDETEQLPAAEAKKAGLTPCAACQPEV